MVYDGDSFTRFYGAISDIQLGSNQSGWFTATVTVVTG